MRSTERRRFHETKEGAQEVHMPWFGHSALSKSDDGPAHFQTDVTGVRAIHGLSDEERTLTWEETKPL